MVLVVIIGFDNINIFLANDVRRVFPCQTSNLLASGIGMRIEDAENVRDVIVGEARVLFP